MQQAAIPGRDTSVGWNSQLERTAVLTPPPQGLAQGLTCIV